MNCFDRDRKFKVLTANGRDGKSATGKSKQEVEREREKKRRQKKASLSFE